MLLPQFYRLGNCVTYQSSAEFKSLETKSLFWAFLMKGERVAFKKVNFYLLHSYTCEVNKWSLLGQTYGSLFPCCAFVNGGHKKVNFIRP